MDPKLIGNMMNNINPDTLKQMASCMNGMSDEDLRKMSQMSGVNMDPSTFRANLNAMQNMNSSNLEQMKRQAQNVQTQSSTKENKLDNNVLTFKNNGNELFKQEKYIEASDMYLKGIYQLEDKDINDLELEISLRLNYANCQSKLKNYDFAVSHAKKVLKKDENNGKANFRIGFCLYQQEQYQESKQYLEKAIQSLPNDKSIQILLQQTKEQLQKGCNDENLEEKKQEKKMKTKNINLSSVKIQEDSKEKFSEGIIQEEQLQNQLQPQQPIYQEHENQGQQNPNQMIDMMKNMDNETLKRIYQSQGMNMSDEQINMIKNMMTPSMIEQAMKMQNTQKEQQKNSIQIDKNCDNTKTENTNNMVQQIQMASSMLDNPQMIRSMIQFLGEDHAMAKIIKGKSDEEIMKILGYFKKIAKVGKFILNIMGYIMLYWKAIALFLLGYLVSKTMFQLTKLTN